MPSLFAALELRASAAVDSLYGEPTRLYRGVKGEFFSSAVSPSLIAEPIGIVDVNPTTVRVQDEGSYDGMQPQLAGEKIHVSYADSQFLLQDARPQQDDLIWAYTRSETAKYLVTGVDPDGIGRFICVCKPA